LSGKNEFNISSDNQKILDELIEANKKLEKMNFLLERLVRQYD